MTGGDRLRSWGGEYNVEASSKFEDWTAERRSESWKDSEICLGITQTSLSSSVSILLWPRSRYPIQSLSSYTSKPWKSLQDLPSTWYLPRAGSVWNFHIPSHRCRKLYEFCFCLCPCYSDGCLTPEYGLSDSFDFIHLRPQARLDQCPPYPLKFWFRFSPLVLTRQDLDGHGGLPIVLL